MSEEATELVVIENMKAVEIFDGKGAIEEIIAKVEKEAKLFVADISTAKGRKSLASLAYKVSKTKTTLDAMGKELNDDARKQINLVDADRKMARDRLDALRDFVREPLTKWENLEKDRVAALEQRFAQIVLFRSPSGLLDAADFEGALRKLGELYQFDWQEFQQKADEENKAAKDILTERLEQCKKQEAETAELEKLRLEKAEREKKEREDAIAREAADKARLEAEEKAKAEREEAEKKARKEREEIERKAEAEREAAERKRAEDERRVAEAEQAQKLAEERAAEAAQKERDRIETERKTAEDEATAREADKKHRAGINNAAVGALVEIGLEKEMGQKVVSAIAKAQIPNVKISY